MESVGERVRRLRIEHGWSQSELGKRIGGLSVATVSKIENNHWTPGRGMAEKLADAFGVTPMELFGWEPSDGIASEVASRMRNLPTEQQKIILAFVQFVQKGGLDGI